MRAVRIARLPAALGAHAVRALARQVAVHLVRGRGRVGVGVSGRGRVRRLVRARVGG